MESNAVNFIVFIYGTFCNLYLYIVMLRLLLQFFGANYYNPVSQFVAQLTNPFVLPLRRFMPNIPQFDLATVILFALVTTIKIIPLSIIQFGTLPSPMAWLLAVVFGFIVTGLNVFFYAIIFRVILSWVSPPGAAPIHEILFPITEPLLAPARRAIPPIAGFDISPIIVLVALQAVAILLRF